MDPDSGNLVTHLQTAEVVLSEGYSWEEDFKNPKPWEQQTQFEVKLSRAFPDIELPQPKTKEDNLMAQIGEARSQAADTPLAAHVSFIAYFEMELALFILLF